MDIGADNVTISIEPLRFAFALTIPAPENVGSGPLEAKLRDSKDRDIHISVVVVEDLNVVAIQNVLNLNNHACGDQAGLRNACILSGTGGHRIKFLPC